MLHEQAKIQQHYKRLVQQRQETENSSMPPPPPRPQHFSADQSEDVYSGEANLPASLAAARPGSRTGITGTPSDPRFANFEEIQRHLSRRPAQYHSQVSPHPSECVSFGCGGRACASSVFFANAFLGQYNYLVLRITRAWFSTPVKSVCTIPLSH
jgi:hypothetical protein